MTLLTFSDESIGERLPSVLPLNDANAFFEVTVEETVGVGGGGVYLSLTFSSRFESSSNIEFFATIFSKIGGSGTAISGTA